MRILRNNLGWNNDDSTLDVTHFHIPENIWGEIKLASDVDRRGKI